MVFHSLHVVFCRTLAIDTAATGRNGLHPGGFVGVIPEADMPFCTVVAEYTATIAASQGDTLAQARPFPVTIGDIDAALAWLWEPE
ncbi:hypothetical protein Cob_v009553 [Colletotrichum orbiculare MAFF 240422]|uniref:Uncharacterized protein n=1 Tax=Colletotrichum orbiculare (strain 104-T / ATCC 96160 / CBS 514.97 / LARS 414 / MAFF 240422) TaxID=1213857 RepID=N4VKM7_COLOR|nr:hypothetical protein Cob_v009553 [Colletotrichum orbiculare MAFF 240422]